MSVVLRRIVSRDRDWVERVALERWGGPEVVRRGEVVLLTDQEGFIAEVDGEPAGVLTLRIEGSSLEVVSIDSLQENRGVGNALLGAAVAHAREAGCTRVWLVTTNDNLRALGFYQRRGFRLVALRPDALAISRRLKPTIGLTGENGIPLRDELELELNVPAHDG